MYQVRVKFEDQIANWSAPEDYSKVAIHLAGLPNTPLPVPGITEFLTGQGYALLQPHYPGTHDSAGVFDPYATHVIVPAWMSALERGLVIDLGKSEKLEAKEDVSLLSSHSYGTYVGMRALREGAMVDKAVFFCTSFAYGKLGRQFGQIDDKSSSARYVRDAFPLTFRTERQDAIEEFYVEHSHDDLHMAPAEGVTDCFVVSPGADETSDPKVSQSGALNFLRSHAERFSVGGNLIAEGAGHAVASMLNEQVRSELAKWLNTEGVR
ncbi:hypothetical protein AB0L41_47485 [Amycolatopsis mediterranei]|uniref:hypothetical protein n=1 Tax=Amycolatopsis mediterranei TaxID=33910 RepID=UPI00342BB4A5